MLFPPYLPTSHVHQRINLLTGLLLNTAFGLGLLCCASWATFVGTLPLGPRDTTIHHTVCFTPNTLLLRCQGATPSRRKIVHPARVSCNQDFLYNAQTNTTLWNYSYPYSCTFIHFIILEIFRESIQNLQKIINYGRHNLQI